MEKVASKLLKHFLSKEEPTLGAENILPTENSSPYDQLIYILRKISEKFEANLFMKIDTMAEREQFVSKATSPMPTILVVGMYKILPIFKLGSGILLPKLSE